GDEAGECSDGADNDQDGLFDCDDPNCAGAGVCAKPTSDDDDTDVRDETNNDDPPLGPIELTNEMIDHGILDNNDWAVVMITADWDGPSRTLLAQMADFDNSNSSFELYVANIQNDLQDDILPSFEQFREGILMPESIPSIAIISFEEQIIASWTDIQEAALVDIVCTLEQRDSISEAFTFEQQDEPTSEDLHYTRITSVTVTPDNPHSHENPICSAQWESNEYDDGALTVMYSWGLIWNESAFTESEGNDPDSIWYSNFSESGIFDRNDTDWRTNPNNGEPFTNVEIANQSISGKELTCSAFLMTQAFASGISELDYEDLVEGVLVWYDGEPVRFQSEGPGDDCEGNLDCAGVCNGDSTLDECGVCDGDGSTCATCGNITYTGCCSTDEDGNYTIVTWCENEQISTIDCWYSGEGCGWRDADGFYGCVDASYAGTEDPSGEHPCDCSELESEDS
ncbi:MAG: hypothetical protein VX515_01590, partial [Candidatus Thermoplasmatota archaeon]|nr:hypothetical protein [Candidatus Thermoplasmatota archaeon]